MSRIPVETTQFITASKGEMIMKLKYLIPVIAIVSVGIMVVWGTLANSYQHSWLAVFAGGIAIAVVSIINKSKNDKGDD